MTPLLTHWSYCSLALSHQYGLVQDGNNSIANWSYCILVLYYKPSMWSVAAFQCSADDVLLNRLQDLEDATNDLINQLNRGGGGTNSTYDRLFNSLLAQSWWQACAVTAVQGCSHVLRPIKIMEILTAHVFRIHCSWGIYQKSLIEIW